ncbi:MULTISPECIES: SusC/RagA family TonB-linked outer membrane protein [Bacteroidales]|uniref:SusC/RagA family TonB-linked outer membrane protein n=1 Tax=Bacteroidales TaxID=171549 RepID=UPI0006945F09|nr:MULTISPECIES: TonB-dependent receptor [Bacteroidales]
MDKDNCGYIRRNNRIWIHALLMLFFSLDFVYAYSIGIVQEGKILVKGVVVDTNNVPLIGVSVIEKGTNNGTMTNMEGAFTITVQQAESVLSFSYLGYVGQEIKIGNRSKVNVTLLESMSELDEVVVVGYGTKRKGGVTAAVSTIGSQDIIRSTSTTTSGAIVGKIAGITARQKSGLPGAGTNLQIRNMGEPLYVIDGIISDVNAFNSIDVNDIDNISVLKDGSAAIYGVKAANGVILVTTKGGKKNQQAQVSVNAYTGWQQWTKYPEMLNAYEWSYINYMKEVNDGIKSFDYTNPEKVEAARAELEKYKSGYYNPETGEDYRGYDWWEEYIDKAAPQNYINASIIGGSDKASYYVSLSHVDQDAVLKEFNYNRTNLQANFDIQINKNVKIGYQGYGKIEKNINPAVTYDAVASSLFELQPIYRPYANNNPLYLQYYNTNDGSRNIYAFTKDNAGTYDKTWRTIRNNITFEYKTPLKGLKFNALFSYYYANNIENNNAKGWKEYSYEWVPSKQAMDYVQKYEKKDTERARNRENMEDITGQFLLNYDNIFNNKHHITGVVGFEFYQRDQNSLWIRQNPVSNPFVDLMTTNEINATGETKRTISTASFVFRASYDFEQKYIIDFAGRYDGSWKFPKGNRWGFFPSVSGAWRISEEDFFKESSVANWLSNVKFRVSYGEMGDDNVGTADFDFLPGYTYGEGTSLIPSDPINSGVGEMLYGTNIRPVPNDQISWMTASLLNIGVDLGFFNNKLTAEFDLFKRKIDGIAAIPDNLIFPLESGMTAMAQNLNSNENVGVDGFIKWSDKIRDFNYFVGVNFTLARQKNGKRNSELFLNAIDKYRWSQSNRWANVTQGRVWMWETIGVFQTQDEIDNYPVNIDGNNNTSLVPGDLIFKDVNGDGIIDDLDKRPLGYASVDWPWATGSEGGNKNPLMSLGINFGFEWRGIDFAADFAGGFMNTFVPDWGLKWGASRAVNGYVYNNLNVWHHEDIFDPTSPWVPGDFPALRTYNPSSRSDDDFYTKEINYLRLRNLVVGYSLPQRWTQRAYIQKLRLYFEGSNLFCWDSMKKFGFDPEISTTNGRDYPQHRTFTIGVNLTF